MRESFIDLLDSPRGAVVGLIGSAASHLSLDLFANAPLGTVVLMDITYGLVIGGSVAVLDGFFTGRKDNVQVDS